jgi:hypothetical protein
MALTRKTAIDQLIRDQWARMITKNAGGAGGVGGGGGGISDHHWYALPSVTDLQHGVYRHPYTLSPRQMIGMRLHIPPDGVIPFDRIEVHHGADKYLIWVVNKGQSVVLEDETGLFPSDALITQLRLLMG